MAATTFLSLGRPDLSAAREGGAARREEAAGYSYFATEAHYAQLAERVGARLGEGGGFIRITGEAPPDGELLLRCLERHRPGRFSFLYCRPGASGGEPAAGAPRVLILGAVDGIPDGALQRLCEIAGAGGTGAMPVILLTTPAFDARLRGDALASLAAMIATELRVETLESGEAGAFIAALMADLGHDPEDRLPADTVAAIAASAAGDPAALSRLVRATLDFRQRTGARLSGGRAEGVAADAAPKPAAASSDKAAPAASGPDESALVISLADFAEEWRKLGDGAARSDTRPAAAPPLELTNPAPAEPAPHRIGIAVAAVGCAALLAAGIGYAVFEREPPAAVAVAGAPAPSGPASFRPAPAAPAPPAPALPAATRSHPLPHDWPPAIPAAPAVAAKAPARIADRHDDKPLVAVAPPPAARHHEKAKALVPPAPARVADRHAEERPPAAAPTPAGHRVEPKPIVTHEAAQRAEDRDTAPPQVVAPAAAHIVAPAPARIADRHESAPPSGAFGIPKALLAQIVAALAPTQPPAHPIAATPEAVPVPTPKPEPPPKPHAVPAAPAPQRLSPAEIALCLKRGGELMRQGDAASARLFFERAADDGDAGAARRLARTYDPLVLRAEGMRGVRADPAKAVHWYRKAVERGDAESQLRLKQLLAAERRR